MPQGTRNERSTTYDVAVVGGGLLGSAIAWGLARIGQRVALLDEGDRATRASRGNFALVWVQSKGLGMSEYAGWTVRSSNAWAGFADELCRETGVDVSFERPGGFHLALSERELEARALQMRRLHNQPGIIAYETKMLSASEIRRMLPDIGPEVVGGSYCPLDGHVNSQQLLRAFHTGLNQQGAAYLPSHCVEAIARDGGVFQLKTPKAIGARRPRSCSPPAMPIWSWLRWSASEHRCFQNAARSSSLSAYSRSCAIRSSRSARPTRARS